MTPRLKTIIVIPARFSSTRFPGKPLVKLAGKAIIQHVYEAVQGLNLPIIIATDNEIIEKSVKAFGAECVLTSDKHQSGSDRIAEVVKDREYDLIINVQGDEPFIQIGPLKELILAFNDKSISLASLMHKLTSPAEIENPNNVKVVCGTDNKAIYFSRSPIPFNRDKKSHVTYFKHVGVYAYTKKALLEFVKLPMGKLESIEKLEQLRFLENGYKIKMVETTYTGIGIDTPEDLLEAEEYIKNLHN
jgi:3-deoxy-D-manno-octulosonate cytidylyltransferase